jgi:glycosyltransferase involved in cell wall biosynthesis
MDNGVYRLPAVSGKYLLYDEALVSLYFPPSELKRIGDLNLDIIHTLTPNLVGMLGLKAAQRFQIPLIQQYCTDLAQYAAQYPKSLPFIIAYALSIPFLKKTDKQELMAIAGGLTPDRPHRWANKLTNTLIPITYNQSDHVVAVSKKVARMLSENGVKKPMSVIPTGVNTLPVNTKVVEGLRSSYGLEDEKVILSVGRLSREKNLELLIDMMEDVLRVEPKTVLMLVGDFDYRPVLEAYAQAKPYAEKIIFAGKHQHAELGNFYALADVFVFPSVTDTQGLVVHEAAAAGLPIVMIDKEVTEVVHEGENGYFASNDPHDFADKVLAILKQPDVARQFGQQSLQIANKYTEEQQTQALIDVYDQVTTEQGL